VDEHRVDLSPDIRDYSTARVILHLVVSRTLLVLEYFEVFRSASSPFERLPVFADTLSGQLLRHTETIQQLISGPTDSLWSKCQELFSLPVQLRFALASWKGLCLRLFYECVAVQVLDSVIENAGPPSVELSDIITAETVVPMLNLLVRSTRSRACRLQLVRRLSWLL